MAGRSIISMPPGMMPAEMISATQFPGILAGGKAHQNDPRRFRFLQEPHRHLGDHPEQAFRAGEHAEQIQPVTVQMLAAKPDDLAGDQHHFKAKDIVGGEAVFQAMHPAGIFRHIAANGAGDLRGGVRRVVESPCAAPPGLWRGW